MRFAVRLPTSNRVSGASAISEVAAAAEALGFYAVSLHDHLVFNGAWLACGARDAAGSGDDRDMYEALTTLSFVAGQTRRVKLLTAILLLPTRETVLMAKQLATLDVLSNGRLLLGIGIGPQLEQHEQATDAAGLRMAGHSENAHKEYATFRVPRQRGRLADEQLAAMRAIWTQDKATFQGRFVQFEEIECFPKPVQAGGPAIWIGGRSEAALRRLIAFGDAWLPNVRTPDQVAAGLARLAEMAAAAGKPAPRDCGLNVFTCITPTDEEALALFAPTMGNRFAGDALVTQNLVGSVDTVIRRLREFQAVGVNLIEMKPIYRSIPDLLRMMEIVVREIAPALDAEPTAAR